MFGCVSRCWFLVHKSFQYLWQFGRVLWLVGLPLPSRFRWVCCHLMRHIILSFDLWRLMCYRLDLYHLFLFLFSVHIALGRISRLFYSWWLVAGTWWWTCWVKWDNIINSAIIMLLYIYVTCFEVFVPDDFCIAWLFCLYVSLPRLSIMLEKSPYS